MDARLPKTSASAPGNRWNGASHLSAPSGLIDLPFHHSRTVTPRNLREYATKSRESGIINHHLRTIVLCFCRGIRPDSRTNKHAVTYAHHSHAHRHKHTNIHAHIHAHRKLRQTMTDENEDEEHESCCTTELMARLQRE
eukprot:GHVU01105777.1.p1 GENE.GHVU01105777.1~~GHVU01105777.1.p1  ORF type:complete len:139 (-),score=5.48 GHVU01105777.1:103-519(-)